LRFKILDRRQFDANHSLLCRSEAALHLPVISFSYARQIVAARKHIEKFMTAPSMALLLACCEIEIEQQRFRGKN